MSLQSQRAFEVSLAKAIREQPLFEADFGVSLLVSSHLTLLETETTTTLTTEEGVPLHAAPPLSLACVGCAMLPSDMDDGRNKHPVCPKCVTL